jgi:hypothetical protein
MKGNDNNMKAEYLIKKVEEFCKENNLDISKVYEKMAVVYQEEWGVNIDLEMHQNGFTDMALYLEKLGTIERYIHILNGFSNCINNKWDLALDKI